MVEERITDGRRIAELLASELHGREDGGLAAVAVVDADRDVEPAVEGTLAYRLAVGHDSAAEDPLGDVFVHPDRVRVELRAGQNSAVEAADGPDLRVRPKAVEPPRTLLFVEAGAAVKRAADAVGAAADAADDRRG